MLLPLFLSLVCVVVYFDVVAVVAAVVSVPHVAFVIDADAVFVFVFRRQFPSKNRQGPCTCPAHA